MDKPKYKTKFYTSTKLNKSVSFNMKKTMYKIKLDIYLIKIQNVSEI